MTASLHPALILVAGALVLPLLRGRWRGAAMVVLPLAGFLNLLGLEAGAELRLTLAGLELHVLRVDRLSLVFGYLFHLAALVGAVYALHLKDSLQPTTGLIYAGSAVGAVFAGDLITLFLFWELLAVTSVFQIWARRTDRALGAGMRYLLVHVTSGLLLLAGAALRYHETGSLAFGPTDLEGAAAWLLLLAFGVKCAFPLLHTWLVDAYPEATPTGTVFLSAFTTKAAVYCLARGFAGAEVLIWVGAVMTLFPIFFAVIENDLRRVLGYSMINQIGFMVVGVGLGEGLGVNGAVAHAFNDVFFKGVLFMSMGAVLLLTGRINGSDLGGLYKSMPCTAGFCIVGASSISAFPLFSGFVSKSMVMAEAADQGHVLLWLMLLFASAGVFHHAGIKIPFFAFFSHDAGIRCREAPRNMLVAMGLGAAVCLFNGIWRGVLRRHRVRPVHTGPRPAPDAAPVLLGPGLRRPQADPRLSARAALGEPRRGLARTEAPALSGPETGGPRRAAGPGIRRRRPEPGGLGDRLPPRPSRARGLGGADLAHQHLRPGRDGSPGGLPALRLPDVLKEFGRARSLREAAPRSRAPQASSPRAATTASAAWSGVPEMSTLTASRGGSRASNWLRSRPAGM